MPSKVQLASARALGKPIGDPVSASPSSTNVPKSGDPAIESYSCAFYYRGLTIHGRAYVYLTALSFESILMRERVLYQFCDISHIELKGLNTLNIVFHARAKQPDIVLCSFFSRNHAFELLSFMVERNRMDDKPRKRPTARFSNLEQAGEFFLQYPILQTPPKGDNWTDSMVKSVMLPAMAARIANPASSNDTPQMGAGTDGKAHPIARVSAAEEVSSGVEDEKGDQGIAQPSESSEAPREADFLWVQPDDAVDRVRGSAFEKREHCASVTLPGSVEEVTEKLFSDSSHGILREFHDRSKVTELEISNWLPASEDTSGFRSRMVTFTKPLSLKVGPSSTRIEEANFMSFTRNGGAIIETHAHALDVPVGNSFRVELYYELSPNNTTSSDDKFLFNTNLKISVAVHFTGYTMLKSVIKSNSKAEAVSEMKAFADLAQARLGSSTSVRPENREMDTGPGGPGDLKPSLGSESESDSASESSHQSPTATKHRKNTRIFSKTMAKQLSSVGLENPDDLLIVLSFTGVALLFSSLVTLIVIAYELGSLRRLILMKKM